MPVRPAACLRWAGGGSEPRFCGDRRLEAHLPLGRRQARAAGLWVSYFTVTSQASDFLICETRKQC